MEDNFLSQYGDMLHFNGLRQRISAGTGYRNIVNIVIKFRGGNIGKLFVNLHKGVRMVGSTACNHLEWGCSSLGLCHKNIYDDTRCYCFTSNEII